VKCSKCGERFLADTTAPGGKTLPLDDDVIDIGLAPFEEAAGEGASPIQKSGGLFGKKSAQCPRCKATIQDIGLAETRCDRCAHYFIASGGYLRALDENHVAPAAPFVIPMMTLERAHAMPRLCCACGAPSTRDIRVSLMANLSMPHCARHSVGASVNASGGPYGIRVVSYRFYREFMHANGAPYF
jgi:hypothetical protein